MMSMSLSFIIDINHHQPLITMGVIVIIIFGLKFIMPAFASHYNDEKMTIMMTNFTIFYYLMMMTMTMTSNTIQYLQTDLLTFGRDC